MPITIFDKPQFNLVPDAAGARLYANVSNRVNCALASRTYDVALAVPTELFSLCREVLHIDPSEDVYLGLDQIGERYVFSVVAGDDIFDLWDYSSGSLPPWITNPAYRL